MKKLISLFIATIMFAAFALPSFAGSGFSDVEDGRWSASSIEYAVKNGYMKGVGAGRFDPEGSLTRAMVATVLWRREGSPAPTAPSGFTDVPDGEWYTDAVAWAKETGVVKGLSETEFGPDELITREQLSTMLFRFSADAPVSVPERADLSPFADDEKVSDWASEPLEWAVEAGLIKGTDGNRLSPDGSATREQFAAILERYDGSFKLVYNRPVVVSHHTEKEYPLVTDADFYVSTDGDDTSDGSLEHPFASFGRAVAAVRELKQTKTSGDFKVAFKAGLYESPEVNMTEEDSGSEDQRIVYCKYGDGEVVFSSGDIYDSADFEPVPAEVSGWFSSRAVDNIGRIDISGSLPAEREGLGFRFTLFSDTEIMCTARYPSKYADGDTQFLVDAVSYAAPRTFSVKNPVLQNRISKYHTMDNTQIYGYMIHGYQRDTLTIESYDAETHELVLVDPNSELITGSFGPYVLDTETCITNVSEELDADGEYWLDRDSGYLYVYNPKGAYYVPGEGTMITMDKTDNVTFLGLSFKNCKDRFISGRLCHGITLDRCRFEVSGADNAVRFDDSEAGRDLDLVAVENEFRILNGGALHIGGDYSAEGRFVKNVNVLFDNNYVELSNINVDFNGAVSAVGCSNSTFSHNYFYMCHRAGIYFEGAYDSLVEYNVFDHNMYASGDGGAIYSGGGTGYWGKVIRYNIFYEQPLGTMGSYGTYMDGHSGDEIYGNIFFNTGDWSMVNTVSRDEYYHDNVTITHRSGGDARVWITTEGLGDMDSAGAYTSEEARRASFSVRVICEAWEYTFENCKTNPLFYDYYMKKGPWIFDYHFDFDNRDDPNFILNPVSRVTGNVGIWWELTEDTSCFATDDYVKRFCTYEDNKVYSMEENPMFVNPTVGDYRIRDGA
ncbi:MAG: S-layer homology domain-containing protein, partial [Clostridia bacterium]|nr:S-layer homology domain-containing protein [Clostridia bacterium]